MIDFKQKMEEQIKKEQRGLSKWEQDELLINSKKKKKFTTYLIVIIAIALIFSGKVIMSSQSASDWLPAGGFFDKLKRLVPSVDRQLQGEENDRINMLLIGMGGAGHDGAYLADTIILASFKPSTKQISLISIPRDLSVPLAASGWRKVNNINAFAEAEKKGSGGEAMISALSDLLDIQIDYYVRADFDGFKNVIDEIGGVEVNVENAFDDYSYPIDGREDNPDYYSRFEHLHFDSGLQKMDGSLALKYARSRHAYGIEGSDFARAARQQLLLEAVKNKLLSRQTLLNPVMIGKLVNEFNKNINTNLNVWEIVKFWNLFKDVDRSQIINKVLSDAPDGMLVSSMSAEGAYILTPSSGNFSKIKLMIQTVFGESPLNNNSKSNINSSISENIQISDQTSVIINNGTFISGLASETSTQLKKIGFNVLQIGNTAERSYKETVIYDLSYGKKNDSLDSLKQITGAIQLFDSPEWLKKFKEEQFPQPDFLLILGENAK